MSEIYDLIVIGGGPAGMMTAGQAGSRGARVLLLEKNKDLGKKILITGKGRCNITQAEFDLRKLVETYGKDGRFLFSTFHKFGSKEIIDFFESRGVELKIERGGRVFPVSDDAKDIVGVMKKFLRDNNVEIMFGVEVKGLEVKNDKITAVKVGSEKIKAKNVLIATGGLSYPVTGSTGDGFKWAKDLGHTVIEPAPALVPLKIKEPWTKKLQGLTLKNVGLTALQGKKKITYRQGDMLFTHFGISGPIVLDMSKEVVLAEKSGKVEVFLNLKPALSSEQLDARLQRDFKKYNNKAFKNALSDLLAKKMIPIIIEQSGIDPEKKVNSITKAERLKFLELLQNIKMTVTGNTGYIQAIVTSGGVDLKEIDPKTMRSKLFSNLYFAGEVLNIDGPTGGYNLQVAWGTGYTVGESVEW
ncbi:NAD(P)/FAD-dependent oxidoreductase [Patescibacteria group bacterium]|nr:NAD(P)/FAD-dependent oxidoreductase [Patescibacteria group bacterium]